MNEQKVEDESPTAHSEDDEVAAPSIDTDGQAPAKTSYDKDDFRFPPHWDGHLQLVSQKIFEQWPNNLPSSETAARDASLLLEQRIRELSGAPTDLIGVELMNHAFHKDNGKLMPTNLHPAEAEGVFFLFRGAVQQIRNPLAHQQGRMAPPQAFDAIAIVNYLIQLAGELVIEKFVRPFLPSQHRGLTVMATRWADVDGDGTDEFVLAVREMRVGKGPMVHTLAVREDPFGPVASDFPPIFGGLRTVLLFDDIDDDGEPEIVTSVLGGDEWYQTIAGDWHGDRLHPVLMENGSPLPSFRVPVDVIRPAYLGGATAIGVYDNAGEVYHLACRDGKFVPAQSEATGKEAAPDGNGQPSAA
jgi:uncharacterized protein (TIGR02391 family)